MKSKFLAGIIATLTAIIVVTAIAVFLTLVLEIEPTKNWFTVTAAFITISTWLVVYRKLKPKLRDEEGNIIEPEIKTIDDDAFKKAYIKTSKNGVKAGIFFTVTCIPGGICLLLFAEEFNAIEITGLVILFFLGGLGTLMIVKARNKIEAIKNGTDPLMSAIENNDSEHVFWFFGIITTQEGNPIKSMRTFQISVYSHPKNKGTLLLFKNEESYNETMVFLESKFPKAALGYSAEVKKEMKEKYGLRGVM
ncbi:MAG: hypothetical protein QNK23_10625 [Crocinitomicaceae bacterium]|nr:hypothetical protein [Crocinitomicaceae bacterium]